MGETSISVLGMSYEAAEKIGVIAVILILLALFGVLFIGPALTSTAAAHARRMEAENSDDMAKLAMIKSERERFDNERLMRDRRIDAERNTQWSQVIRKLDQLIPMNQEILKLVRELSKDLP